MSEPITNERGNQVTRSFLLQADRYLFDFQVCSSAKGWKQFDTKQDASYFGIWVHSGTRRIVTFAEGDLSTVTCPTVESFQAELASMATFYGPPPPAAIRYDADGTRTEYYDERPTGTEPEKS